MKKILLFFLLLFALVGGFFVFRPEGETNFEERTPEISEEPEVPRRVLSVYTIEEGDTFATAVETFGIGYADMLDIVSTSQDIYDFTRVRLGRELRYEKQQGDVVYLEYDIDTEQRVIVEKNGETYTARAEDIPYEVTERVAGGQIVSSLFVDANKAGLSDALILEMAEILGWTIDFATQVREGDRFKVYYEERELEGVQAGHGTVFALEFVNAGKKYRGYLFEDEEGKYQYYDGEGNSLIRQFLKAPLKYNRITSGFSYARFHPVIQQNAPHKAIDYAAPVGTPVRATADGRVRFAGWNGGFGNYIDIRHNGIYDTQYAHLSSYAKGIRAGVDVVQGQVIGYVGSTGWSTGPHLHYQIKKHGTLVNPLTIELPAGDPVPEGRKAEFLERKKQYDQKLDE